MAMASEAVEVVDLRSEWESESASGSVSESAVSLAECTHNRNHSKPMHTAEGNYRLVEVAVAISAGLARWAVSEALGWESEAWS
jgi:hypothetical protein